MLPVTIVHAPAGGVAVDLTPILSSVRFDTAAIGGFGSLEASFPGDLRTRFAYLGITTVMYGPSVLWEGQLEDVEVALGDEVVTTIRCFGLKRRLEETSTRRIWSKRDIPWVADFEPPGYVSSGITKTTGLAITTGRYLLSDQTKAGVQVAGSGQAITGVVGNWVDYFAPLGMTLVRLMSDFVLSGPNTGFGLLSGFYHDSTDGLVTIVGGAGLSASVSGSSIALTSGANGLRLGMYSSGGGPMTPTVADVAQFSNIRILATALTEDASGGFYGGTILRDLLALVPGLTIGTIEDGSDFTIQAIERSVRDSVLSVLNEVAGYYTREWGVWEDGRFDWTSRNLDAPQWMLPFEQIEGFNLQTSTDGHAKTVYVLYTDAASGIDAEQSATATDQRNPYVRQAKTKDTLVQPGFPMTSNTAAQLASVVAADIGARPPASGRVTLKVTTMVANAVGPASPAAFIRGGDNVLLPDMPKTDPMLQGRDGETLFHVVTSDVNLASGTVSLELEGQQSRQSVLLARLAAVTRVLTG